MHILQGRILTPFQEFAGRVGVENGLIVAVGEDLPVGPEDRVDDFGDNYICPGFFDLHVHGGKGFEVLDGEVRALEEIAAHLVRHGVTAFLGTTMAAPYQGMRRAAEAVKAFWQSDSVFAPALIGLHLEGPCLNARQAGAQPPEYLCGADQEFYRLILEYLGVIKTVTLAPEVTGGLALAYKLKELGVYPSLGHTGASADLAREAFAGGVQRVTHLFNAMPGIHHREPGLAVEALLNEDVFVELIADGVHVAPRMVEMVWRLKGAKRVCLVSDAVRPAGLPDGEYTCRRQVMTVQDQQIRLVDGTLAGGYLTLAEAVRNLVAWGKIPLREGVEMVTATPARAVGLADSLGSLAPGRRGDLVVLDHNLQVVFTMLCGKVVFRSSDA
ncbi:MAG TPA: N-acetylglucosamine-6-phosphate deacetylase [Bacillota bacterium]|nr:N-acetylglucosamine-6-phosphate deacetylase [Bacillota bacterium]HPT68405.1 N-acetylglucosamine-6-phosphate deacetylase [Bacillota bacterium]